MQHLSHKMNVGILITAVYQKDKKYGDLLSLE